MKAWWEMSEEELIQRGRELDARHQRIMEIRGMSDGELSARILILAVAMVASFFWPAFAAPPYDECHPASMKMSMAIASKVRTATEMTLRLCATMAPTATLSIIEVRVRGTAVWRSSKDDTRAPRSRDDRGEVQMKEI
jgi:hypothetical protein